MSRKGLEINRGKTLDFEKFSYFENTNSVGILGGAFEFDMDVYRTTYFNS